MKFLYGAEGELTISCRTSSAHQSCQSHWRPDQTKDLASTTQPSYATNVRTSAERSTQCCLPRAVARIVLSYPIETSEEAPFRAEIYSRPQCIQKPSKAERRYAH